MKNKSKILKTAPIVFFILATIYIWIWYLAKSITHQDKICYSDTCFVVEIADTNEKRQIWLMNRESMSLDRGMLFIFPDSKKHNFWMKNTLIPLDIIRINSDHKIVDIKTSQPCYEQTCPIYTPKFEANYVLEINAWIFQKENIQIWDVLEFKVKGL